MGATEYSRREGVRRDLIFAPHFWHNAAILLMALSWITSLGSVVCWVIVLIKMFSDEVVQGVLGLICGLWAFIWGWIHADEHGLRTVMLAWSACVVLGIVFSVGATALGFGGGLTARP